MGFGGALRGMSAERAVPHNRAVVATASIDVEIDFMTAPRVIVLEVFCSYRPQISADLVMFFPRISKRYVSQAATLAPSIAKNRGPIATITTLRCVEYSWPYP